MLFDSDGQRGDLDGGGHRLGTPAGLSGGLGCQHPACTTLGTLWTWCTHPNLVKFSGGLSPHFGARPPWVMYTSWHLPSSGRSWDQLGVSEQLSTVNAWRISGEREDLVAVHNIAKHVAQSSERPEERDQARVVQISAIRRGSPEGQVEDLLEAMETPSGLAFGWKVIATGVRPGYDSGTFEYALTNPPEDMFTRVQLGHAVLHEQFHSASLSEAPNVVEWHAGNMRALQELGEADIMPEALEPIQDSLSAAVDRLVALHLREPTTWLEELRGAAWACHLEEPQLGQTQVLLSVLDGTARFGTWSRTTPVSECLDKKVFRLVPEEDQRIQLEIRAPSATSTR